MKVKEIAINKYINMIRPYLVDMMNVYKSQSESKIQLTAPINFISSSPDSSETCILHANGNNVEIMIGSETNEIVEELFKSPLRRYQEGLEELMRGSEFGFVGVNELNCDLNKISLNRGKSYIQKATINPKNKKDDRCF